MPSSFAGNPYVVQAERDAPVACRQGLEHLPTDLVAFGHGGDFLDRRPVVERDAAIGPGSKKGVINIADNDYLDQRIEVADPPWIAAAVGDATPLQA